MFSTNKTRLRWAVLALTVCMILPAQAFASGITLGRFGGIYGHPNTEGGLGMFWNPARLSANPGFFGTLDATILWRSASWTRTVDESTATEDEILANSGDATVATVGALPYSTLGYSIPLGGINLAVAGGVFPSIGGMVSWDRNPAAPSRHPGAVDGPQRWSSISSEFSVVHYVGGLAVTLEELGLSVGTTVAYVNARLNTTRARNLNRSDSLIDSDGVIQEGRVHLDATDEAVSLSFGVTWENDVVTASANYRMGFDLELIGPVRQTYSTNEPTVVEALLVFPVPHIFQSAFTLRLNDFEGTFVTDFTTWSDIVDNDTVSRATGERLLLIPRNLENTLSVRLLPGWNLTQDLNISGLVGFDPSAVPANSMDASLSDADKIQIGFGVRYYLEHLRFLVSYTQDIYFEVEVTDSVHQPHTNGFYNDARGLLNLSVEATF